MAKRDLVALASAVEKLHGVRAEFIGSFPVHEQFEGKTVWKGLVSQFEIRGHPTSKLCYAWSEPVPGGSKRRFYAVLHAPPVDSPLTAVKASIVDRQRRK